MKISIVAACALATLGLSAFAQAYVGIGVGTSHATAACISGEGHCGDDAPAEKLLGGWALPGTDFAIEGAYSHLGTFRQTLLQGDLDARVDTFGVGGAWRPQFGAGWGGVARLGVGYSSVKTSSFEEFFGEFASGSYKKTSWHPTVGVGATYAVSPKIRLEADFDYARPMAPQGRVSTDAFTLGATFGF